MAIQDKVQLTIPASNKWHTEDLEAKAEKVGMSRSEYSLMALDTFMGFDNDFIKTMQQYADGYNIPLYVVIQNFVIDKLAKEKASDKVYGQQSRIRKEFITVSDGAGNRMMTGEELDNTLVDLYTREYNKEKKEIEDRRRYYSDPEYRKQVDAEMQAEIEKYK